MKSIPDFVEYLSKHCLKKGFKIKSSLNTNNVRSFCLYTKKDKKIKFTKKFDGTCLEDCQYTIFETDNFYITPLDLAKHLLLAIDNGFLSKEGKTLKKSF